MVKKAVKKAEVEQPIPVKTAVVPTTLAKLSIDYPSEGLNNMAMKINEIIDHLNGTR